MPSDASDGSAQPVAGTPGASARVLHEHLRERREIRIRARFGRIGVALARLAGDPQHIAAWKIGAEGEERAARRLEKLLTGSGVHLLHDRAVPSSAANIDHVAVGPGGVTVIDTKNVKGKPTVERRGSIFGKRTDHLTIDGRDRTSLIVGVESQMATIAAALADLGLAEVPVAGTLCWIQTEGLPLLRTLRVRDVAVLGPRHTAKLAARPGPLTSTEVDELTAAIARRFPCR